MIQIKRIYEPAEPDDGFRVLVDRIWPRGLKKADTAIDLWLKEIAPSTALRHWFDHDPARWEDFRKRYKAEVEPQSDTLAMLRSKARRGTVTLLYAARDIEHNNAAALERILSGVRS
ncbi:Uncharacterized conserved protein YeaO, DUF488 family [Rhizobiales bacterium GAS191]|nr:Uncharacterized conserved protein YeaO, DUF488 family [Rhizobiales bacterium GAS191]